MRHIRRVAIKRRRRVFLHKAMRPHRFRPRLLVSALAFLAFFALSLPFFEPLRGLLVSFSVTGFLFLFFCLYIGAKTPNALMPRRAGEENEQKWVVLALGVAISAIVLVGLGTELSAVEHKSTGEIVLSSITIMMAWGVLNMLFAFHYAHEFYRHRKSSGTPVQFPGTKVPDYFDFIYFGFTIGMTFQVSDVIIRNGPFRHIAFLHALISFIFNVVVLALVVNVFVGVMYFR